MAVKMGGSQNLHINTKMLRSINYAINVGLRLKYVIAMFLAKTTWRWKRV